jgi:hypothetical protein
VSTTEPQKFEAVDVVDEVVPPVWSLVGFIIFAGATGLWVRDTRRDIDALPEDHHHH